MYRYRSYTILEDWKLKKAIEKEEKAKRKHEGEENKNKGKFKRSNNKNIDNTKHKRRKQNKVEKEEKNGICIGAQNMMRNILLNVMIVRSGLNATNGATLIV